MTWKLIESHYNDGSVAWYDTEEGVEGALVGDTLGKLAEDPEVNVVEDAARNFYGNYKAYMQISKLGIYICNDRQTLKVFLSTLKSVLKSHRDGKPWPDWAIKAKAEGWKPPRGWQP